MAARAGREGAAELRRRFQWLESFSDDELRQISFCSLGHPLREDEEYFDLSRPERGVLRGLRGAAVEGDACLVARLSMRPELWEKLTRFFEPPRPPHQNA